MTNSILKIIILKAFFLLCLGHLNAQEIETKKGVIKGVVENEIEVFKGIPFAAAPVGELRW